MRARLAVTALLALAYGARGARDEAPMAVGALHAEASAGLQLAAAVRAGLAAEGRRAGEGAAPHESPEPGEALGVLRALCSLATTGAVGAVCGGEGASRAAAVAARAGLPLLLVEAARRRRHHLALALYPHEDALAGAALALLHDMGWDGAVLLHAGPAPGGLLTQPGLRPRRLPPPPDPAPLRDLLLVLKGEGETRFLLWCERTEVERVLDAAQKVGLLSARHAYLLSDGEPRAAELEPFSYGGANVTALRLVDAGAGAAPTVQQAWEDAGQAGEAPASFLLAHDATRLLVRAWRELRPPGAPAGSCAGTAAFLHAETLVNHMRTMRLEDGAAATGELRLDEDGARRDVALQAVELRRGGELLPVALWRHGRLASRRTGPAGGSPEERVSGTMANRTFNILIAYNDPYVMQRKSKVRLSGNDQYEGFCIELIEKLAEQLNFNYTFELQRDGNYSVMMQRVTDDGDVHFAITDLTITSERAKQVDFTTPFMNLGISILYKRPEQPAPGVFAFLLPFSTGVWVWLLVSFVASSLVLYAAGRLCPAEWQNPYPCVEEPGALENQFTLANAFWFNLGSVLLQGSDIAPVAYGTRAVASMWWMFALVMTSSYTANLASLLAKKDTTELIHDVTELAKNPHGINYGAKSVGSTYSFFQNSQDPIHQEMYRYMIEQEMPLTNQEGVDRDLGLYNPPNLRRVRAGKYAFLMESTTIEYLTQRICELKQVGGLLDNKGYGIAMKKDSPYRQALNLALLNLQERGKLREMKNLWWNEKNGGGACGGETKQDAERQTIKNYLGLFLVLAVGVALGVVLSCADLLWHAWRRARGRGVPFSRQLRAELRFVFSFSRSVKPLELALSPPPSPCADSSAPSPAPSPPRTPALSPSPRRSPARTPRRRRSTQNTIHSASMRLARHASAQRS